MLAIWLAPGKAKYLGSQSQQSPRLSTRTMLDRALTCGIKQREKKTKISGPELALAKQEEVATNLFMEEAEGLWYTTYSF